MLSITVVLWSYGFWLHISVRALGHSVISTRRENFAGGSAGLPMLSKGLEIEQFDFEAENAMLTGNYLQQAVENVIGGISTSLEVNSIFLFMSLRRIPLQGFVLTNLFDPMRHLVDLQKVEVGI